MFSRLSGPAGPTFGAANTAGGGTAPVITSPAFLVAGTQNTVYPTTTFTATGTAPITWSIFSGTLPAGMTFVGGVLAGTPTATFSGSITFRATNAFGFADRPLTLTVDAAPPNDLPNVSATITPLQGARSGTPITVNAWSLVNSVTNFAGQWAQYVGTIPGADENIVVYMWTGPSSWRCLQISGKLTPALTRYSNGSVFYTDSSKTTLAPNNTVPVLTDTKLAFNASVTESGSPIPWICGAISNTKTSLSNLEVYLGSNVFAFNSVPAVTMSNAVDLVKQWKIYGVYTNTDLGAPAAPAPNNSSWSQLDYDPETAAPISSNWSTYQGLILNASGGDNFSGRSYYEAGEAQLLNEAIQGITTNDTPAKHWKLMSQALNVARVPQLCLWDDSVHRITNPQKGSRPYYYHTAGAQDPAFGKEQYQLKSFVSGDGPLTHPWTGTTYYYAVTGCPIFSLVGSGVFCTQISTEYSSSLRRTYNRTSSYTPSINGTVDRSESWSFGRASKLTAVLPSTGRVPGGMAYSELQEFLTEALTVPSTGVSARVPRRQAQTTPGATVDDTLLFLCKVLNTCQLSCPDPLTWAGPSNGNTVAEGARQSTLMLHYALENTILLAAQNYSGFTTYVDELIEQYSRCIQVYGGIGICQNTVRSMGPQVTALNAGSNWTQLTLSDMQVYANSVGQYSVSTTNVSVYDPRFMIVITRFMYALKVAADKGRISATSGAKALSIYNALNTAASGVTNGSLISPIPSYGNYFGVPASLVSQMA